MTSKKYCNETVNLNVEVKDTLIFIGPDGCRGYYGPPGDIGDTGTTGLTGNTGPIGSRGVLGTTGNTGLLIGPTGIIGPRGDIGITGPIGRAQAWYINDKCETPTGAIIPPNDGDLLLIPTNDNEICIYQEGGWTSTNQSLKSTINCEEVYDCLTEIKVEPDPCNFSFSLTDCPPLFQNGNPQRIVQLILLNQVITLPPKEDTYFSSPQQLGIILQDLGWDYTNVAFDTYIYLYQQDLPANSPPPDQLLNRIFFSTGQHVDIQVQCASESCYSCNFFKEDAYLLACGLPTGSFSDLAWLDGQCIALTGPTGLQGFLGTEGSRGFSGSTGNPGGTGQIGPSNEDTYDALCGGIDSINLNDCQYCGVVNPACINFFNLLTFKNKIEYSVETLYVDPDLSPDNGTTILGPSCFTTRTELNIILTAMNITIKDNLVRVTKSPNLITHLVFRQKKTPNSINPGKIITQIELTKTLCCPPGFTSDADVLIRSPGLSGLTGYMWWVPAKCVIKPLFDLPQAICDLPPLGKYKCTLTFDTSLPFLKNQNFPWSVTSFVVCDQDMTKLYQKNKSYQQIYNIKDLTRLLKQNGWTNETRMASNGAISPVWTFCKFSDQPLEKTQSRIKLMDQDHHIFFCYDFPKECLEVDLGSMQLIYQSFTGLTGISSGITGCSSSGDVKLGPTRKFLDSFPTCDDTTYQCTVFVDPYEMVATLQGTLSSPWEFNEIVLAGEEQMGIPVQQFSSVQQLKQILLNQGWEYHPDNQVFSFNINNLQTPSSESIFKFVQTDNLKDLSIKLQTTCLANCEFTDLDRLILSRAPNGDFCWLDPNCFNRPVVHVDTCTGCTGIKLTDIACCNDIKPEYDLTLEVTPATLDWITKHFGTKSGPYWINGYILEDGTQIELEQMIDTPLTLTTLAKAFQKLGWFSDPACQEIVEPEQAAIDQELAATTIVTFLKDNNSNIIRYITFNLAGERNFNLILPIYNIPHIECDGLPKNAQLLVKQTNSPTGLDCICTPDGGLTGIMGPIDNSFGLTGRYCYVDIDCIVPSIPPPINFEKELGNLPDCDVCEGDICGCNLDLGKCVEVTMQNVIEINDSFSPGSQINLYSYKCVDGNICFLPTPKIIGTAPVTLEQFKTAFLEEGWTLLEYSGIEPGFRVKLFDDTYCPAKNPLNQTLIRKKKENGDLEKWPYCWTKICPIQGEDGSTGLTGFTGPPGSIGITGTQGSDGLKGATGMTGGSIAPSEVPGPVGPLGVQGPNSSVEDFNGINLGGGVDVFSETVDMGSFVEFQFKSLIGDNIEITCPTPETIEIGVSNNFDWSNFTFSGLPGSTVDSTSSLRFENGAALETNQIEETTATNGVVIDTTNGSGLLVQDGGIEFENNGPTGPTLRPSFLEFMEFGEHDTGFFVNNALPLPVFEILTLKYQRIGNVVTLFFPGFSNTATGTAGGSSPIVNDTPLPVNIRPTIRQSYLFRYQDSARNGNPIYVGGPSMGDTRVGTLIILPDGFMFINPDINDGGWDDTTAIDSSEPMEVTYLIS